MMAIFRTFIFTVFITMLSVIALTYHIKTDVQKSFKELARLESLLQEEQNSFNLLQADWALMTRPERLSKLAKRYENTLELNLIRPHQIISLQNVPEKRDVLANLWYSGAMHE